MTSMYQKLKSAARKRSAYHRTVREIESLPLETALDVGIYPGDARTLARRAVYGGGPEGRIEA